MSYTNYLITNNIKKSLYTKIYSKLFFYHSPKSVLHLSDGLPSTEIIFKCIPDLLLKMI